MTQGYLIRQLKVPKVGLEPTRFLRAPDFESGVSTSSTTSAVVKRRKGNDWSLLSKIISEVVSGIRYQVVGSE